MHVCSLFVPFIALPAGAMFAGMLLALGPLGMHLDRPIRPRLPASVAAAVAPLLAVAPLPASAAISQHLRGPLSDLAGGLSDVTLTLASRGDGSQGLIASITRDPTDVYYGLVATVGLLYLGKNVAERRRLTLTPP